MHILGTQPGYLSSAVCDTSKSREQPEQLNEGTSNDPRAISGIEISTARTAFRTRADELPRRSRERWRLLLPLDTT
jgi:hypothetical protein